MTSSNDKLTAGAANGASISQELRTAEQAEAHGMYGAVCTGPVEHLRARYVALQERLGAKGWKAQLDRLINKGRMLAELALIPIEEKWAEEFPNVVTTEGKNFALDTYLAGSGYTKTGPYMFLINTNASTAVAGNTMGAHAGWLEVGVANAPGYKYPNSGGSAVRGTVSWSAASGGAKATASPVSFYITSAGTVGGCGLVFNSTAVNTIDSTAGTMYSAGEFTGGPKTVTAGDTLNVTYTASL